MPSVPDLEESNSELPGAYSNIGLMRRFSEVDAKTEAKGEMLHDFSTWVNEFKLTLLSHTPASYVGSCNGGH